MHKAKAQVTTYINDNDSIVRPIYTHYAILEDSSNSLRFNQILSDSTILNRFKNATDIYPKSRKGTSTTWIRIKLKVTENLKNPYVLEFLDHTIDALEVYLPCSDSCVEPYVQAIAGDNLPFFKRSYQYKNFTFKLPPYPAGTYFFYFKIKSNTPVNFSVALKRIDFFHSGSLTEYFYLSIFYGLIFTVGLISFFTFLSLWEWSFFFYSLYAFALCIFFVFREGLGFQFFWPSVPELNDWARPVSYLLFMSMHMLYAIFMLRLSPQHYKISWPAYVAILVVVAALIGVETYWNYFQETLALAILPITLSGYFALVRLVQGHSQALYIFTGNLLLITGIFFDLLNTAEIVPNDWLGYYGLYFGFGGELLMLSVAMAIRLKTVMHEKNALQMRINQALEAEVKQRTEALERKNKELDTFIYRASHDIKGPLKSILGVVKLALAEANTEKEKEYLQYIQKSTQRLDTLIADLLKMNYTKEVQIQQKSIVLMQFIQDVIKQLYYAPDFKDFKIYISGDSSIEVHSDPTLLHLVCQNLVENAVKYKDTTKKESFLRILITRHDARPALIFRDNGLGIPEKDLAHIFDLFYRTNKNSNTGTGLGLHIVKEFLDKLHIQIEVKSKEKEGTRFTLLFQANEP